MDLSKQQIRCLNDITLNLREDEYPFFTDDQLIRFLEAAEWDVKSASYNALIEKAENDETVLPSGLKFPSSRQYWLSLAKKHKRINGGTIRKP